VFIAFFILMAIILLFKSKPFILLLWLLLLTASYLIVFKVLKQHVEFIVLVVDGL
jgi:ABC-type methionine transport system permease subunit